MLEKFGRLIEFSSSLLDNNRIHVEAKRRHVQDSRVDLERFLHSARNFTYSQGDLQNVHTKIDKGYPLVAIL